MLWCGVCGLRGGSGAPAEHYTNRGRPHGPAFAGPEGLPMRRGSATSPDCPDSPDFADHQGPSENLSARIPLGDAAMSASKAEYKGGKPGRGAGSSALSWLLQVPALWARASAGGGPWRTPVLHGSMLHNVRRRRALLICAGVVLLCLLPSYVRECRRAWSRRRIPEWKDGRYHHHVSSMTIRDPAYAHTLTAHDMAAPGLGWASPSEMLVNCPVVNASLLPEGVLRQRVFVALNLRDNEGVMANLLLQLALLAKLLPQPQQQLFVSVFESNSGDATVAWVRELGRELSALGVPHVMRAGTQAADVGQRQPYEDRIDFLARMRNQAIKPLLDQAAKGVMFDRVVFINDVFFCAYEVLRLLMYEEADLACGLDLYLEPEPYRDPLWTAVRKELTFYDVWVARDSHGQRFQWAPPFIANPATDAQPKEGAGSNVEQHYGAVPVFCCWDGLAVLRAWPFYEGLRFRSVPHGEGVVSECSNLCTDLWANGYTNVIVDPQVKLTYDEPTYERLHATMPPTYLPSLYHVDTTRLHTPRTPPTTVSTCHLEVGVNRAASMVKFEHCFDKPHPLQTATRLKDLCYDPHAPDGRVPRVLLLVEGGQGGEQTQRQWDEWRAMHVDYEYIRYTTRHDAEAVLRRHVPLVVPLLNHVQQTQDWEVWRAVVSLALLWHHGGLLLPLGIEAPVRSLECALSQQADEALVTLRVEGSGANTSVLGASRHHEGVRALLQELFFQPSVLQALATTPAAQPSAQHMRGAQHGALADPLDWLRREGGQAMLVERLLSKARTLQHATEGILL